MVLLPDISTRSPHLTEPSTCIEFQMDSTADGRCGAPPLPQFAQVFHPHTTISVVNIVLYFFDPLLSPLQNQTQSSEKNTKALIH